MEGQQEGWDCFPAQRFGPEHIGNSLPGAVNLSELGVCWGGQPSKGWKGVKSKVILLFPEKSCVCPFALGLGKGEWSVCCIPKNQQMIQVTICWGASLTWCQLANWAAVQASVKRFWDEAVLQTVTLHVILMTSLQHLAVVLDSELTHLFACLGPSRNDFCLGG